MTQGINFNDLQKIAQTNPQYTQMLLGLTKIDTKIKKYVEDIICNSCTDSSLYYIKTELMGQCYTLYLYNSERKITVGVSWPLIDFLKKCEDKIIEYEIQRKINLMLNKFDQTNLNNNINWIDN